MMSSARWGIWGVIRRHPRLARIFAEAAAIAAVLLASHPAAAAFTTTTFSGDGHLSSHLVAGSVQAMAEARYGSGGSGNIYAAWELATGRDTTQGYDMGINYRPWNAPAEWRNFTITYTGSTLSINMGFVASYDVGALTAHDLFIRAAGGDSTGATMRNLAINGVSVGVDLVADASSHESWLVIQNAVDGAFTITGQVAWNWSSLSAVSPSNPDLRFLFGTAAPDTLSAGGSGLTAVPEPASAALLTGPAALLTLRRPRRIG